MHTLRTVAFRLGAVTIGLGIALMLTEAGIRLLRLHSDTRFVGPHPLYGVFNIPSAEGWYVKGEVRQYVTINSRGLHDRDQWSEGNGVLLVGDSFIAAFQVPPEASCQEITERLLSQAVGRPVEVTAAACNGWGTRNQVAFLQHEAFTYRPAAVVLALFPDNDLLDNLAPPPAAAPWPPPPHRAAPLLTPDFIRHAVAVSPVFHALTRHVPPLSRLLRPASARAERALVRGLYHVWHATPTEIQNRMWAQLEDLLIEMRGIVTEHDANLGILVVPGRLAIYPDEVDRLIRRKPMLARANLNPALPRSRLAELLESMELPYLDLLDDFRAAAASGTDPLFPREGHWTEDGNRIAAQGLCRLVLQRHLLEQEPRS
ncbi:SGNH/GDSL hydrolase family protein [Candidatus Fermentibacteria bacterium]|nr:SGNH/GDSL hydrolase family protein [Candidatus Fermentibacteria bacterium]